MCLILLAVEASAAYPLVIAANRDEYYDRPTAPAGFWPGTELLGGQDLRQGGSWFGVTRRGRLAMVTNVRAPGADSSRRSRGHLVRDFLQGEAEAEDFAARATTPATKYPGFNLILGRVDRLWYAGNRPPQCHPIAPGIHGLSNAGLNTPWPKVSEGREALAQLLASPGADLPERLFALLRDDRVAADANLPETGIGLEWERALSARFIRLPGYGTRASSLLLLDRQGRLRFVERSFGPHGEPGGDRTFSLQL